MQQKEKCVLGIIPARGGSKRLPGKHTMLLLDKLLIEWTIDQAKKSKLMDRLIVNTDDKRIANIAKLNEVEVPFIRSPELAKDDSSIYDVIFDTLKRLKEKYDIVVLLEPTSPLRKDDDIDKAIQLFLDNYEKADSLVSVGEIQLETPYIDMWYDKPLIRKIWLGEKALKPMYFPYGVIYVSKVEALKKYKSFYQEKTIPYFIERWQNYEVNDEYDFKCIETILRDRTWVNGKEEDFDIEGFGNK